jgi:L-amino acid N-acyltransferase YncA
MIREVTINDSSRMVEIHVFSWRCAYKEFIPIEYLINNMTVKNAKKNSTNFLSRKDTNDKTYVYEENGIVKGFMTIGDCRDNDKAEGIYVDPIFQRKHIGTKLLNYCIKEAMDKSKKEITLRVFEKNYNSIQFYKK